MIQPYNATQDRTMYVAIQRLTFFLFYDVDSVLQLYVLHAKETIHFLEALYLVEMLHIPYVEVYIAMKI